MASNRASISFILQHPQRKTSIILLNLTAGGKRLRISSNQSVEPKNWDASKQRVKSSAEGSMEINKRLNELCSRVEEIYLTATNVLNITPTPEYLREKILAINNPKPPIKEISFFDRFEEFITASETMKKKSLIRVYKTILMRLRNSRLRTI